MENGGADGQYPNRQTVGLTKQSGADHTRKSVNDNNLYKKTLFLMLMFHDTLEFYVKI